MAATTRAARVRRALAISSAAVVVAVAAAACGTAAAATDPHGGDSSTTQRHRGDGQTHSHDPALTKDKPAGQDAGDGKDAQKDDGGSDGGGGADAKGKDDGQQKNKDDAQSKLDILGTDCKDSKLELHDGFQKAPRCVETSFGEVTTADKSPSLLITQAPETVKVKQPFQLVVSSRNLKRDRFLGAAVGGYYAESSFLDENGIQRGHFHTACRNLPSLDAAPDAAPTPAFFLATQDNKGGAGEDKVTIDVPGFDQAGTVQCAVWAGDGSHRVPMMERANQTPAFDTVRINVK